MKEMKQYGVTSTFIVTRHQIIMDEQMISVGITYPYIQHIGITYHDEREGLDDVGKIAASAVLGGTVAEIGGGKFANGAITAAYSMMFNDMMHPDNKDKKTTKKRQKNHLIKTQAKE